MLSLNQHIHSLLDCRKCPEMQGKPVHGCIPKTKIISIGQAPGVHEERLGRPFAYTAGKTLFQWFSRIGVEEEDYRKKVNMAAVCRCFPGKAKSGDRKPSKVEIENCRPWLGFEIQFHKPKLILPIGKLAIAELIGTEKFKLEDIVGTTQKKEWFGVTFDWIPLPHPSGLNVWNHTDIGKKRIAEALQLIRKNKTWKETFDQASKIGSLSK